MLDFCFSFQQFIPGSKSNPPLVMYTGFHLMLPNKNSESQQNTLVWCLKKCIDRKEAEEKMAKPPGAGRVGHQGHRIDRIVQPNHTVQGFVCTQTLPLQYWHLIKWNYQMFYLSLSFIFTGIECKRLCYYGCSLVLWLTVVGREGLQVERVYIDIVLILSMCCCGCGSI